MKRYCFLIIFIALFLALSSIKGYAQKDLRPIAHDSLMALNKKAFSLIFTHLDSARLVSNQTYSQALLQKDSVAMARALSVIGGVNWASGRYNLALKLYFNSLSVYDVLGDTTGIIISYNNIAEVYKKLKYYDNALRYLNKAKKLIVEFSEISSSTMNLLNTAELYLKLDNTDSVAYYLSKAKSQHKEKLSVNTISLLNFLYAKLSQKLGKLEEAEVYIEQSIYFAQTINNELRLCNGYTFLGELLMDKNLNQEAESYLKLALEIAERMGYEYLELETHQDLYLIKLEAGDTISAITNILKYSELKDKIYTISISRQATEFETMYELEKMEQKNSLLQIKQTSNDSIIKYQIAFIAIALLALAIAVYLILALNKQQKSLKVAIEEVEQKSKLVESQKAKLESESKKTSALNKELKLLNKNLDTRAQEIAREIEVKNKKMNKYAFMNAHKLRAPIASILGLINLFGKYISAQDEKTMIEMLKDSAQKLDDVVHEIKDVIDE